jgi:hypothetical protein
MPAFECRSENGIVVPLPLSVHAPVELPADRYRGLGKRILLLGIGFDAIKRRVDGWKLETL